MRRRSTILDLRLAFFGVVRRPCMLFDHKIIMYLEAINKRISILLRQIIISARSKPFLEGGNKNNGKCRMTTNNGKSLDSGVEPANRKVDRSVDRQSVHGSSEASKHQPQINKQARRETLLSLDDFTQCHTSTWQVATVQLGNLATLLTEQLATWQVASGDVAILATCHCGWLW